MEPKRRFKNGKPRERVLRIAVVVLLSILVVVITLPSLLPALQNASEAGLRERAAREAVGACIKIVEVKETQEEDGSSSTAIGAGGSGVVIGKIGTRYIALTAAHVLEKVPGVDRTTFTVLLQGDLDYSAWVDAGGESGDMPGYYRKLPQARIERLDTGNDLALVSFASDVAIEVRPLAMKVPSFGDSVVAIGNPWGSRNVVTAGIALGSMSWDTMDAEGVHSASVLRHTTFGSQGSSGCMLLNTNMEIVGIILGAKYDLFGRAVWGAALPCDRIRRILAEWQGGTS